MIFKFGLDINDRAAVKAYEETSRSLRSSIATVDVFRGIERFESSGEPGRFVAIAYFDDEHAVAEWRNAGSHRRAQMQARAGLFQDYRLRMARVLRDYGPTDRSEAPEDSNRHFALGATGA